MAARELGSTTRAPLVSIRTPNDTLSKAAWATEKGQHDWCTCMERSRTEEEEQKKKTEEEEEERVTRRDKRQGRMSPAWQQGEEGEGVE